MNECRNPRAISSPGAAQKGVVLVVSLMILLTMTLVGITAMRVTVLEERMSGNLRDQNLAFQASESALMYGIEWVRNLPDAPDANESGSNKVWEEGVLGTSPPMGDFGDPDDELDTGYIEFGAIDNMEEPNLLGVVAQPRLVVEESQFIPDDLSPETRATRTGVIYYTVTALGYGGSANARSMVQAVVAKRFR